jgi:hypothetical protein
MFRMSRRYCAPVMNLIGRYTIHHHHACSTADAIIRRTKKNYCAKKTERKENRWNHQKHWIIASAPTLACLRRPSWEILNPNSSFDFTNQKNTQKDGEGIKRLTEKRRDWLEAQKRRRFYRARTSSLGFPPSLIWRFCPSTGWAPHWTHFKNRPKLGFLKRRRSVKLDIRYRLERCRFSSPRVP